MSLALSESLVLMSLLYHYTVFYIWTARKSFSFLLGSLCWICCFKPAHCTCKSTCRYSASLWNYVPILVLKWWKMCWKAQLIQNSNQEWPVNTERSVWKDVPFLRFRENSLSSCSFRNIFLVPVCSWSAALEYFWILQCTKDSKKKKEWRAAGRQCSGAHPVLPRGRNRPWGKKCIKNCITRRWKYPGLRVGQGPVAVTSGAGQSGITVIFQKQTSHCEVADSMGSTLFLGVGSEASPCVSWSPTACGILVKLHIPRRSPGSCGDHNGAWFPPGICGHVFRDMSSTARPSALFCCCYSPGGSVWTVFLS